MSRRTQGGLLFVVCALFTIGSIALAQLPNTPNEIRPLMVWAACAGAFGMLAGVLSMGRH